MARPRKYSDELRRRAIEEVLDRGRKIPEVARSLEIGSPETLRDWVRQAERDRGLKPGPTTEELAEIKKLRKEVADQQRTIEILKAATTFSLRKPTPSSRSGPTTRRRRDRRGRVRSATRNSRSRSNGSGMRTTPAMGRGGSGSSCAEKGSASRAAPSNG
jgi:transposase